MRAPALIESQKGAAMTHVAKRSSQTNNQQMKI
jgi:hypothetical protein